MAGSAPPSDLEARANDLYWGSGRSVNQIAEEMDLSKGAFYGLLRPLATGRVCPECGAGVGYPNRTARDRGSASCPECGYEGPGVEPGARAGDGPTPAAPERGGAPSTMAAAADRGGTTPTRASLVGAALLGMAAGFLIAGWTRRR